MSKMESKMSALGAGNIVDVKAAISGGGVGPAFAAPGGGGNGGTPVVGPASRVKAYSGY